MEKETFAVDTHFHIWELNRFQYKWPTPEIPSLYRDFTIEEYEEEKSNTPVKYSIFVQVNNNALDEIEYMIELSKKHPFLKGIVGGIDVTRPDLRQVLAKYKHSGKLVGVRHILDFEDSDWLTRDDVISGLQVLADEGLTFDLLLRPPLLKHVPQLAERLPGLKLVVDHIAKPLVKEGIIHGWKEDIAEVAKFSNIYCKISGLVNEGDLENWKTNDFIPYVTHILAVFGADRCMFGSDWPVLKMSRSTYDRIYQLAHEVTSHLSQEEKQKFFCDNAISFYNLKL